MNPRRQHWTSAMLLVFFADARWVGLVVFMLIYVAGSFVQLEASERCYINLVGAIDHTALCVQVCGIICTAEIGQNVFALASLPTRHMFLDMSWAL